MDYGQPRSPRQPRENWEITAKSTDFIKRDSATIDFPVTVAAKGETTLTYSVHYTW